jgi:hypothetical protein
VWRFRSQAPTTVGALPDWYECFGLRGSRDCAFLPMVFLDHDLPLDGLNRAPEGRYTFTVSLDAQPFAPPVTARRLQVEVSYDDGATWDDASVRRLRGNRFTVTTRHPRDAGFASLRITGSADNGSEVTEELIRAYRIR